MPVEFTSLSSIEPSTRELLTNLRNLMLDQHKHLLDREKAAFEAVNGPVGNPGQFLNLVLGHPQFTWLKTLSTLVVEIDEALARRSKAGQPEADALVAQVRDVVRPRQSGTDFQIRYYAAVQDSPDVVILQVRIERLLGL